MSTRDYKEGASSEIGAEFSGAPLGDVRLESRLGKIVREISNKPAESFPIIFEEESKREAFYRFLRNPNVSWGNIIEPHFQQGSQRALKEDEVIAIHDSSALMFSRQDRSDFGYYLKSRKEKNSKKVGFLCHFSFVVSGITNPKPLGVLNINPMRRFRLSKNRGDERAKTSEEKKKCESYKWIEGVRETRRRLTSSRVVHVMDREADDYMLLSEMVKSSERFVIRVAQEKRKSEFDGSKVNLSQALCLRPIVCNRQVSLSKRSKPVGSKPRKSHRERCAREAELSITATSVDIVRSKRASAVEYPRKLRLNVIHVFEPSPPKGEVAVDWKLFTTEPTDTQEQILKIVDIYRARWTIEELFKALKTGCSYEDRQLESFKTAMNALALLLPIAWQMLCLRYHSRIDEPEKTLTPTQTEILIALSKGKLNQTSTTRELLYAVAALGGHIKNNGAPGWIVLYRGIRELHTIERGVNLNLNAKQYVIND
jgi:IS4 transposase